MDKPYDQMTHDDILREHSAPYEKMSSKERLQQKDRYLKPLREESASGMNAWTLAYLAATAAVFMYWQKSVAAGIFIFLVLALLTRLLYILVNKAIRVGDKIARLEDSISELRDVAR